MTTRLFAETTPGSGQIVHTANSAFIDRHPLAQAWISRGFDESSPAQMKLVEAIKSCSVNGEESLGDPGQSAMAKAFWNLDGKRKLNRKTYFDWLEEDGEGRERDGGRGDLRRRWMLLGLRSRD